MTAVELLTVEDRFELRRNGATVLILHPDFSVPQGWKQRVASVIVAKPNGQQVQATAQICVTHFNIADPSVSIDTRWRLTVWLTNCTKDEVPVGSRILVSQEIKAAISDPEKFPM